MRYIKYIIFVLAFVASSCTKVEPVVIKSDQLVQFVGRVMPFTDYDVTTRAAKNEEKEYKITSLDLIIFNSENVCVYYAHNENGETVFSIDRGVDTDGNGTPNSGDFYYSADNPTGPNNLFNQEYLKTCRIYTVANVPQLYEKELGEGNGINDFLELTIPVTGIDVPSTGMPMLGYYDGTVDLSLTSTVNASTPFQIKMYALYAKISFELDVFATENNAGFTPCFTLEKFEIHNVVESVDFAGGTESASGKNDGTNDDTPRIMQGTAAKIFQGAVTGNNTVYDRGGKLTFSFYLPERFLRAKTAADDYEYPFGKSPNIREEDKVRRQRYKPELAQNNPDNATDTIATSVKIVGVYSNHQGHTYDVTYDIYLGNDNYGNFDIVRNRQYNNYVTIHGINNTSESDREQVSFDHRVHVTRTHPFISNLRRETLLDSHFEVRPLRIRANMNDELNMPNIYHNSAVKVEVIYLNGETGNNRWIGLERSYGDGTYEPGDESTYCNSSNSSAGKRKYFTTDLTYSTLGSNVIVPMTETSQCVWIYIDECTEVSEDIDAARSAQIKLTYGTINNGNFTEYNGIDPLVYIINQYKLFKVTWEGRYYHIEHEEEYLHNYDSETAYNEGGSTQTEAEGMEWGLYNAQLSFDETALYFDIGWGDWINSFVNSITQSGTNPKYDFYIPKHDTSVPEDATKRAYRGYVFCNEIITDINTNTEGRNTGYAGTIGSIQMDQKPTSAIEYCYNRNKRNANGTVASVEWYLPAIDEMEDIIMGGYYYFDDFHNKFYWSSQPSYMPHYARYDVIVNADGAYYSDDNGIYRISDTESKKYNEGYARATRANYKGDDGNNNTVDYEYTTSGTTGYDNAIRVYLDWFTTKTQTFYNNEYNGHTLENWETATMESIIRQEGNRPRDSKSRVRCARKHSATNTNTGE